MKKYYLILLTFAIMVTSCSTGDKNPFLSEFDTRDGVPPFDKIEVEHYIPAYEEGMKQQIAEVDAIINNADAPTFENTIVALDESGRLLSKVAYTFAAIKGSNTTESIDSIAKVTTPIVTEHGDNIYMNPKLFARIKTVYEADQSNLTTEQKKLLEKYYKSFVRSGIDLDEAGQARMREINKEMGTLSLDFENNVVAETKNYQMVVSNETDLAGLPQDLIAAAAKKASDEGSEGKWIFTLDKTSWEPFVQYADNRALREKIYKAMYNRANNGNANDNKAIIQKIVNLRLERVNLLGYNTYADYALSETMAKTPENALKLLNDVWAYALPAAKKESADLLAMAKKLGHKVNKIESWDWWYYAEKVRQEKYALNEEEVKPYLEANNVRQGVFYVANRLYGITFNDITSEVPVYHPDVKAYEVKEADGKYIGTIMFDDYARSGAKRPGAWMSSFRKQSTLKGKFITPNIYNVGNYNPPVDGKPALLSMDQVETMFHEFGHGLHGLLSNCTYNGISGTSVSRDFVELPSQIMEHWAFEPEVMKHYAKHYETGEVIPDALIEKMNNAGKFNMGFRTTEFVAAAMLDMKYYTLTEKMTLPADKFEEQAMKEIGLISEIIPRYKSTYFAHIFSGGYSASYYAYMWAEVLDSDAFSVFEEKGLFDQATAKSFRDNILSKGGSDDPMILYKKFRGAEPDAIHLLRNRGFVN